MNKYKVTLYLMIDPTINDNTFKKVYKVFADNDYGAYNEACKLQDNDEPEIKYKTVFDYKVEKYESIQKKTRIRRFL